MCCSSLAVANLPRAQRSALSDEGDGGNDQDREIDPDEARDYADQGPLPDRDMEEDNEVLTTLFETYALLTRRVSIAEAERIRRERISESRTRAAETRKRRS